MSPPRSGATTGKRMAVALGFALPLSTSIYTQQQQNSAQQLQEQQAAQSRLQAALDRDRGFAVELSTQLRTERLRLNMSPHDGAAIRSPLCELLGHEVQMASDGAYGRYTLGVLVSAFRAPATASSSRTLCECRREGADLLALLKSRQSPLARTIAQRELRPLAAQLGEAREECADADDSAVAVDAVTAGNREALVWRNDIYASINADRGSLKRWLQQSPDRPLPDAVAASPEVAAAAAPEAAPLPELRARVYVQLALPADASLDCLRRELRARSYVVPSFEVVGGRAPDQTQLRYLAAEERPAAEQLLRDLQQIRRICASDGNQIAKINLPAAPLDFSRLRGSARRDQFELWLGARDKPVVPAGGG